MENIGHKIVELRKSKGYTQEELAEKAKVNLRTVQRIENGENKPSANTLKLICEALETLPEKLIDYGKKEDSKLLVLMHLSVITYLIIPIGNILIPLIFWISKKDKIVKLDEKGTRLLNFQITWTFLTSLIFGSMLLAATLELTNPESAFVSYLLLILFVVLNVVNVAMALIIAFRIKAKSSFTAYPNIIRLIK
jgi:transcriptional regulator with XRE-family HTH domain